MPFFDRKPQPKSPSVIKTLGLRPTKDTDKTALVNLERLCYRRFKKDEQGKFTRQTEALIDEDFTVELIPAFAMGDKGFDSFLTQVGRRVRSQVITWDMKLVGAVGYELDTATHTIDIGFILLHPDAPKEALKKFTKYIEDLAEASLRALTVSYDLPDALDTPMQSVFLFLKEQGWAYSLRRNVYTGNIDAWHFTKTFGENRADKKKQKAT